MVATGNTVTVAEKDCPAQPAELVVHPLYDHFGEIIPKSQARQYLGLPESEKIILFFGFIRKYKGLDILLHAMANPAIRSANIHLLVAGEFYDKPEEYLSIIEQEQLTLSQSLTREHQLAEAQMEQVGR